MIRRFLRWLFGVRACGHCRAPMHLIVKTQRRREWVCPNCGAHSSELRWRAYFT